MKIKMELLSDVVFGNGMSVPGAEDISVLCDEYGFPYYKGGTFKGVFREELKRYLSWTLSDEDNIEDFVVQLLGESDANGTDNGKLIFSDFHLSGAVKQKMIETIDKDKADIIKESLTHIRTFTKIGEDGMVKDGSLRSCRCVNKGLFLYSEIKCRPEDESMVKEVLCLIKWIGTMRNRGFGKVKISVEQ